MCVCVCACGVCVKQNSILENIKGEGVTWLVKKKSKNKTVCEPMISPESMGVV